MLTPPLLGLHKAFPNVFSVSHVVPVDGRPIEKRSGRVTIWKRNLLDDLQNAQLGNSDQAFSVIKAFLICLQSFCWSYSSIPDL